MMYFDFGHFYGLNSTFRTEGAYLFNDQFKNLFCIFELKSFWLIYAFYGWIFFIFSFFWRKIEDWLLADFIFVKPQNPKNMKIFFFLKYTFFDFTLIRLFKRLYYWLFTILQMSSSDISLTRWQIYQYRHNTLSSIDLSATSTTHISLTRWQMSKVYFEAFLDCAYKYYNFHLQNWVL